MNDHVKRIEQDRLGLRATVLELVKQMRPFAFNAIMDEIEVPQSALKARCAEECPQRISSSYCFITLLGR